MWVAALVLAVGVGAARRPCVNSDAFYFNQQPKGITIREGGRAFLECNVSNRCNIKFEWSLDDVTLQSTTRRYQNGSNLIITRVNRTLDSGSFKCLATLSTPGVSRESRPALLDILWIQTNASVKLANPGLSVVQGGAAEEMVLHCIVEGSEDMLTFRWFWNGHPLGRPNTKEEDETRPAFRVEMDRLTVDAPRAADNGLYSCLAENTAGITKTTKGFHLAIPDARLPQLRTAPLDELTKLGADVEFACDWDGAERLTWSKVGEDRDYAETGRVRQKGNSLLITSVEEDDEGSYVCAAHPNASAKLPPQAYSARLIIASLAEFEEATSFEPISNMYAVGIGKRLKVACVPPGGFPEPRAYWSRDGRELTYEGRVRAEGLQLVIDSASPADSGNYFCIAENLAGQRKASLRLHVSRAPVLERHPGSLDVEEGETGLLACAFSGSAFPVTRVDWEVDGERLSPRSPRDQKRISATPDGRLRIAELGLADQGEYVCVVRTADQAPLRSRPATLRVKENLKWDPRPPTNQRLKEKQNAQIQCLARGHQAPVVKWLKVADLGMDGRVTRTHKPPTNEFPSNMRDKNGTLYIHGVSFADAGRYICVAASPQGYINKTITIEVSIPPDFYLVPANRTVWEGADVWLHCGARGTPTPKLDWFYESQQMSAWSFRNYEAFPNNSLAIRGVSARHNAGSYSCMAGNKGGLERAVALLCVRIRPANVTHCGAKHGMRRPGEHFMEVEDGTEGGLKTTTIAIAVGAAGGYILLVVCLVGWCAYRRRRGLEKMQAAQDASANGLLVTAPDASYGHNHSLGERHMAGTPGSAPYRHSPRSGVSSSKQSSLDRMGFPRENIDLASVVQLGSGVFGDVFIAPVAVGGRMDHALVKALQVKDEAVHQALRDEMELFSKTEHPNVGRLIGLCRDREPIYVLYHYQPLNLKHYLTYSRPARGAESPGPQKPPMLTLAQIISIAYQVAQGMEHITDLRFVHKDLAARNILLDEGLHARVSSLSLQNVPFLSEYYSYHNMTLPLRWMPAEALFDDDWSMKSDVWSFAVFLWELLSLGELPYVAASNDEVIEGLKDDSLRLALPPLIPSPAPAAPATPKSLPRLAERCWEPSPRERPTFTEIRDVLGALHVETNC